MKTTFRAIVFVLLLGGWGLVASALHMVVTPGNIVVVPKDRLGVRETYADARNWTLTDVAGHGMVVNRLIATHHADALMHVTKASSYEDLVRQLNDAVAAQAPAEATSKPAAAEKAQHPATKPLELPRLRV